MSEYQYVAFRAIDGPVSESNLRYMETLAAILVLTLGVSNAQAELRDDVLSAARKAATFYSEQVATEGGYLWAYSGDLKLSEGEGKVVTRTAWVQPPGTPAMGEAYVRLYEATGDDVFLQAALQAAEVLRSGQLRSGGWTDRVEFEPAARKAHAYRLDPPGKKNQRNNSSLDDDKTQSALRFLIALDRATKFKNQQVHEPATFALNALLAAQYPNGGFPQGWEQPYDSAEHPVLPASYPKAWPREYPGHQNYWFRYTLNDDLLPALLAMLYQAGDVYRDPKFAASARRVGDFLILAQLPEPQPAWAQQYNFEMQPAWARKFEPPAITGGESQGALRSLLLVYRRTGNAKYLEPIPRALAYLKKSVLRDGRLARFYELETNRPLYFTRDYQLTYDDAGSPTHYSFRVASQLTAIEREYEAIKKAGPDRSAPPNQKPPSAALARRAQEIVAALDERGAWVTPGQLRFHKVRGPVIDMRTAVDNFTTLADYLSATK